MRASPHVLIIGGGVIGCEMAEIFKVDGRNEVMGLISWASGVDPDLAPKGHHVLTHMGLAPYNVAGNNWDRYKEQYIEDAIDTVERYMLPGLKEHVVYSDMLTPVGLERELLHPGGAVYGSLSIWRLSR